MARKTGNGALLTYVWTGFSQARELQGVPAHVALIGDVVFGTIAILVLVAAWVALTRQPDEESC